MTLTLSLPTIIFLVWLLPNKTTTLPNSSCASLLFSRRRIRTHLSYLKRTSQRRRSTRLVYGLDEYSYPTQWFISITQGQILLDCTYGYREAFSNVHLGSWIYMDIYPIHEQPCSRLGPLGKTRYKLKARWSVSMNGSKNNERRPPERPLR
jgi:hypothetical protein